ncbi:phage infection protein [Pseudomonas putida]|uniref:phage infection protein n=1 Tax=Pseudomonas putida TaxID=303 RepID=UPI003D984CA5
MFNFSKVSSLALGLALVGGLGLSNLASANTASVAAPSTIHALLAEGGSDRLQQNRVAEGGADRLQELRERVAEGGADRLQELRERGGVSVAENRAEFGSKYQRY